MTLEEAKGVVRDLTPEERRKIALYVLELEKDSFKTRMGPHIAEELDGFSRLVQDGIEKLKNVVNKK